MKRRGKFICPRCGSPVMLLQRAGRRSLKKGQFASLGIEAPPPKTIYECIRFGCEWSGEDPDVGEEKIVR
ncbi:MAG: hypothetical protein HY815_10035 [Candidatus Riflebacteria bacterium]|nr:hypothetical protein [Candidatus Riflebacteria bacterium]